MTYVKQPWLDQSTAHPVSAGRMNHIEDGIADVDTRVTALEGEVTTGSAFPSSPIDGQEFYLVQVDGSRLHYQYDSGAAAWRSVGGSGGGAGRAFAMAIS